MLLALLVGCASAPPGAAAADPPAADASDTVFEPTVLHEVEVTLDAADWAALRAETRSWYDILGEACLEGPWESPYTWFTGAVRFDGEALGEVGVRKKGFLGSLSEERPSLRISTDRVVEGQTFRGLEKLVLNNENQDPSRLRTCLAHDWFADAGLVAPRCALARVTVNGEDLGVYDLVEAIDATLVSRVRGAPPAEMYEGALSDFREGWTATFEAETEDAEGAAPAALAAALEADDDALLDALDAVLDLDAFFTFWAAESLAGHWDGYNGNTNNFYAYTEPGDGRLAFIASGPDSTFDSRAPFGDDQPVWVATVSALANRLARHPEAQARYEARLGELLETAWDGEGRLATLDAWEALVRPVSDRAQRQAIDALREIVAARGEDVAAALGDWSEPAPLRGSPCWTSVGAVSVGFTTTFGSYPTGDLFAAGETDAAYEIAGVAYPSVADGTTAGWYDDDTVLLLTISTLAPDVYVAPYVAVDADAFVAGADIPIDGARAEAQLLYNAPETAGAWQRVAWLGFGSLHLDAADTTAGGTVSGALAVSVLGAAAE